MTDASSIKRHKSRWRNILETQACTVVSFASPKAKTVCERYAKINAHKDASSSKSSGTVHALEKCSSSPTVETSADVVPVQSESFLENPKKASFSQGTIHSFLSTGAASSKGQKFQKKLQTTFPFPFPLTSCSHPTLFSLQSLHLTLKSELFFLIFAGVNVI